MPLIHPEFEVTTPPGLAAEPDTYRGPRGSAATSTPSTTRWTRFAFEPKEFREAGGRVIVPLTLTARGRTTGIEADTGVRHDVDAPGRSRP